MVYGRNISEPWVSEAIAALEMILPWGTYLRGGPLNIADASLIEELKLVELARPKRQREFLAGRHYARQALVAAGGSSVPIGIGALRAPRWPDGFVGTISHTDRLCAAIVARTRDISGIGMDIEESTPLSPDLHSLVVQPGELSDAHELSNRLGFDAAKLIFVAKEAFYKLYSPLTGVFLDFLDVALEIDTNRSCFLVRLASENLPAFRGAREALGRFGSADGFIFAVIGLASKIEL